MKFLLLLLVVRVNSENLWNPFDKFIEDVVNKTKDIQIFMVKEENKFLENVANSTKTIEEAFQVHENAVKNNLKEYQDHISDNSNNVMKYFEEANNNIQRDFNNYLKINPTGFWNVLSSIVEEEFILSPELELSTCGMISANGYPCESHSIVTDDGYILTVHRIPRDPNSSAAVNTSKTVLLHHGILASSADWVFAGLNRSLAYRLSNLGYDVWMANARGNRYSREHTTLKKDSVTYWNFTWHEIATLDLPAVIDHIYKVKGPETKINYVGHSMGNTVLFALLSEKPEYNEKLHAAFALAPVVFTSGVRGPVETLSHYANNYGFVSTVLGKREFFPKQHGKGWLGSDACIAEQLDSNTCKNFVFMLCGFDEGQLDKQMLPIFLAHVGAGTSTKTVVHFSQEIASGGKFQQFDYGISGNLNAYGTEAPAEYSIDNVTLPIVLFGSKNDYISSENDVKMLYERLKGPKKLYTVPLDHFNHMDFLWAKDLNTLVNDDLLELIENWTMRL